MCSARCLAQQGESGAICIKLVGRRPVRVSVHTKKLFCTAVKPAKERLAKNMNARKQESQAKYCWCKISLSYLL